MLYVYPRPEGLDLGGSREDQEWLRTRVRRTGVKLLCIGPLYKMTAGNPNDEQDAMALTSYLDELRAEFGIAMIIEAHMTHEGGGRPFGWSGWRRWCEIGVELKESGELIHWRTPRHETPGIPPALRRGTNGEWPFVPATNPREILWGRIVEHCATGNKRPSLRELATVFGVGKSTIERAVNAHKSEWKDVLPEPGVPVSR
jgi:AAA domain